jgi:S1-C subfamily serine protease
MQRSAVEVIARNAGSAAQRADLRPQDLIIELAGQTTTDAATLHRALRKVIPGTRVNLSILRDGVRLEREIVTQAA